MKRIRRRKERSGECDGGVLKWSGEERSDSERNGRTPPSAARSDGVSEWPPDRTSESPPDPEVSEKGRRRRFTAEYKVRIVREADGCREPGQIGALLRREGLYSSQLVHWRRQSREGAYRALRDDHRGRKRKRSPLEEENERLRNQVARLERRLNQAETIIEFQKTISEVLGIPLSGPESDGSV